MEYRRFGRTDLHVSAIGFGTWPIGGARYGTSDDADAERALRAALDAGITCFDTAPSYGNGHAEELLGRVLRGRRDEVVIVSKGGLIWDEGSHVLGRDSRREALTQVIEGSLRRLGTDYLDLYLIHWPDPATPFTETMAALEALIHSGKTRFIGVSNFTGEQVRQSVGALHVTPLAANQVGFNLFDRRWATSAFATCDALGVGVMAYGPLAHGLLTGAFTTDTTFDATDWRTSGTIFGQPLLTPENFARNLAVIERLKAIAAATGATL
ncbi:MAG: aldo/keto reductase, partial [Thermomicrobiales bacterium]